MKPFRILTCVAAATVAAAAQATPVITTLNVDLSAQPGGSFSFAFLGGPPAGGAFTFAATGDFFNPLAVQDSGSAADSSFGGFLGIPVQPTSDFLNRGVVTFGPTDSFASSASLTTVPFSNGDNLIGLRATAGGQSYFGFAYTTNAVLNSIGFETVAGQAITATTAIPAAAAPEASTWAMLVVGMGAVGAALRRRPRARVRVAFA